MGGALSCFSRSDSTAPHGRVASERPRPGEQYWMADDLHRECRLRSSGKSSPLSSRERTFSPEAELRAHRLSVAEPGQTHGACGREDRALHLAKAMAWAFS
ncbi:hypothetical protein AB1Y20_021524 [Prymnesium parvum]|uniref:Uncharacterized protein n=1 Tax=Prymnesium parvum TaxID=97485 RepID=A0AB34JLT2_PRYPA